MQCRVEKAGRKDELWSPHFKIRWQVNMTKIVMFSHGGKTQWSYSHQCMITRYDHIFCMITCACVMIEIVLIQDTMIISWQYHRRSQVCVAEAHWRGNFIWRVHIVMCTHCDDHILWWSRIVMITYCDDHMYITFQWVSLHSSRLSKPSAGLFPFALSTPHILLLNAVHLSTLFVTFEATSQWLEHIWRSCVVWVGFWNNWDKLFSLQRVRDVEKVVASFWPTARSGCWLKVVHNVDGRRSLVGRTDHPDVVAQCRGWWGRGQSHLGRGFTLHGGWGDAFLLDVAGDVNVDVLPVIFNTLLGLGLVEAFVGVVLLDLGVVELLLVVAHSVRTGLGKSQMLSDVPLYSLLASVPLETSAPGAFEDDRAPLGSLVRLLVLVER